MVWPPWLVHRQQVSLDDLDQVHFITENFCTQGYIFELTDSYRITFLFAGLVLIVSSIAQFFIKQTPSVAAVLQMRPEEAAPMDSMAEQYDEEEAYEDEEQDVEISNDDMDEEDDIAFAGDVRSQLDNENDSNRLHPVGSPSSLTPSPINSFVSASALEPVLTNWIALLANS